MKTVVYIFTLVYLIIPVSDLWSQRRGKYELNAPVPSVQNNADESNHLLKITEKKEIYRIDFLLPLHLENLPNKQQVIKEYATKSLAGFNFYEGILLAIDSIEKKGEMYYDIFVHDISEHSFQNWIQSKKLDSTDLIIGLFNNSEVNEWANFAKERKINVISALTPYDSDIQENPYFILAQPSMNTYIDGIINYADYNKSYQNTVILYREHPQDTESFKLIKSRTDNRTRQQIIKEDKVDLNNLKNLLIKGQKNLIYTTFLSPTTAAMILEQLNQIAGEYQLEVIGYPTWKGIPILSDEKMNENLTVYISYPFRFDEDVENRIWMRNQYSRYKRGMPSELVYRGFETTLQVCNWLHNYGTIFNEQIKNEKGFSNTINLELKEDNGLNKYFENTVYYIYRFKGGKLNVME